MKATRWIVAFVHAALLIGCAGLALHQTFGFLFAMGEAETAVGLGAGAFLIFTVLGIGLLPIGALGSWTRWRAYSTMGLVGALCVVPVAVLFCRQNRAAIDVFAVALDLGTALFSLMRVLQFVRIEKVQGLTK